MKLSERQLASWSSLRKLSDADLYAIIGNELSAFDVTPEPDGLLIELHIDRTEAAVDEGKRRFQRVLEASRHRICASWATLKRQTLVDEKDVVGLVAAAVKTVTDESWTPLILPIAELLCRGCHYSLDVMCSSGSA